MTELVNIPATDSPPAVITSGTLAARPSPVRIGQLYHRTDEEAIDMAIDDAQNPGTTIWSEIIDLTAEQGGGGGGSSYRQVSISTLNADQSVGSGAGVTEIQFHTEVIDTASLHSGFSPGPGDREILIPADGVYLFEVDVYVSFTPGATDDYQVYLSLTRSNPSASTTFSREYQLTSGSLYQLHNSFRYALSLTANQTVEIECNVTNGAGDNPAYTIEVISQMLVERLS